MSPVMTIRSGTRRERKVDGPPHRAQVEARLEAGVEVRELDDHEAVEVRGAPGADRRRATRRTACASTSM